MSELVVNIWFFIVLETDLAYNWSGKVYCMGGTDEEKTQLLKKMSATDYITVKRQSFPQFVKAVFSNAEVAGKLPTSSIDSFFEHHNEYVLNTLEKQLPPILNLKPENLSAVPQKIPREFLFVLTMIFEDAEGNIRPIVTDTDKEWLSAAPMCCPSPRWNTMVIMA
jgi:hypothetical protein